MSSQHTPTVLLPLSKPSERNVSETPFERAKAMAEKLDREFRERFERVTKGL